MGLSAIFLVIFAAAAPACAEQGRDWPPRVTLETIRAAAAPAPGKPAASLPRDGANYSAAEEILIKEFNIPGISLNIPESEVGAQMTGGGDLCFEQALRLAVKSFFEDYTDPASPLATVLTGMGVSTSSPSKSEVKQAGRKLQQLLNMPGSLLLLVREGGSHQAVRGEKVKSNWVLYLKLGYANRSYWAVADRSGRNAVYNYGAD